MVYIIRCNDIISDPRAMKYVHFLQKQNIKYKLIAWDRDGKINNAHGNYYFKRKAGYNIGGIKAAYNRFLWMAFVLYTLFKTRKKDDNVVIHGCDVDSAFPATFFKHFINKNVKVIFDVFDWFSATLYNQSKFILKIFNIIEKFSINHSDYVILCERERIEQIPYKLPQNKILILPNIPYFSENSFLKKRSDCKFNNGRIIFSYVGGFNNERCLSEIINIASKGIINLLIAGFGNSQIEKQLDKLKNCPNIKYFGKVDYTDALSIMYCSEIIYAMYSKTNPNHIYAAPNKFYESLFLGKAIFTTKGTILEKKVEEAGIGYISEEKEIDIVNKINTITNKDLIEKGRKAKKIWENEYRQYTNNFMIKCYKKIVCPKDYVPQKSNTQI